jgi:adenosylcobinamide-phosphate synthase
VADALLGDPARGHPVACFGRAAEAMEQAMWRSSRPAGSAYMVSLVLPVTALAAALDAALREGRALGSGTPPS